MNSEGLCDTRLYFEIYWNVNSYFKVYNVTITIHFKILLVVVYFGLNKCTLGEHKWVLSKTLKNLPKPNFWLVVYIIILRSDEKIFHKKIRFQNVAIFLLISIKYLLSIKYLFWWKIKWFMQSTEVCGIFLKIKYQFKAHSRAVCIQPAERGGMVNNLSFRYINEVVSDVFKEIWLSALMKVETWWLV